jgi:hypothetical protein
MTAMSRLSDGNDILLMPGDGAGHGGGRKMWGSSWFRLIVIKDFSRSVALAPAVWGNR